VHDPRMTNLYSFQMFQLVGNGTEMRSDQSDPSVRKCAIKYKWSCTDNQAGWQKAMLNTTTKIKCEGRRL